MKRIPAPRNLLFLVLLISSLLILASDRVIGLSFQLLAWVLFAFDIRRKTLGAIASCIIAGALTLSPLDLGFHWTGNFHGFGHPRIVPYLIGLPSPEGWAAASRREIVLGGCIRHGNAPRYLVVW